MRKKETYSHSILLVDDDSRILELLKESFLDLSFKVFTAEGGREALDLLLREKVDCIVSDVSMPEMNGPEFIRELYARGEKIPFFYITGYRDYPRESLNEFKPRAIIFKPFDFEEAAMLVKNHLMRISP